MKAEIVYSQLRRQFEDQVSRFMASDNGQRLIAWYEQLGERDRLALRLLTGFLSCVLVYLMVLGPLIGFGNSAHRRLEQERNLLAWLKSHEASAIQAPNGKRDQTVVSLVNSTAEKNRLALRRYEPVDENTVRIWLDGASFNTVLKWLHQLENEHGIHASELGVDREASPGRVSVQLTLAG